MAGYHRVRLSPGPPIRQCPGWIALHAHNSGFQTPKNLKELRGFRVKHSWQAFQVSQLWSPRLNFRRDPATFPAMANPQNLVTINPYFKAHAGRVDEFHALMHEFVEKTRPEEACYFYEFATVDDRGFCREGYEGAAGVLAHLENVGELLGRMEKIADLTSLEFHGPAAEIDKLREPLAHLPATFFVHLCGIDR